MPGDGVEIAVADPPIDVPDGDAVEVTTEDLADLLGRIAVGDLRRLGLDKGGVAAKLSHTRLKRATGAGAAEKEQHRQDLVAQIGMRLSQRPLALQIKGDIQNGLDLFPAE